MNPTNAQPEPITFQVKDADDHPHTYTSLPWAPTGPGAEMFDRLFTFFADVGAAALASGEADAGAIFMRTPPSPLVRDLLRQCLRDGKKLESDLEYNLAFTRNRWEAVLAALKVVETEGFFPQSGIGGLVKQLAELAPGLAVLVAENATPSSSGPSASA